MSRNMAVFALALFHALPARADECTKMIAVTAPCIGVLGPASVAKEGALCIKRDLPLCRADLKKLRTVCDSDRFELDKKLQSCNEAKDSLDRRLRDSKSPVVKEGYGGVSLVLSGLAGVVVGGVVVWLSGLGR